MGESKKVLESFNPNLIYTENNINISNLTSKVNNSNETYNAYFKSLLDFVQSCELAVASIADASYDPTINIERRKDLYTALSYAILNLLPYVKNDIDMGDIYDEANKVYADSFGSVENYQRALQLALYGQLDQNNDKYFPNSDKSTNPFMIWHERAISGYSSCLKTFVNVFGEDMVRKVVTPSLYQAQL